MKRSQNKLVIFFGLFIMLCSAFIPSVSVFASPNEATLRSYGITMYDPAFVECGSADGISGGTVTTTVKISDTPEIKSIFTSLIAGGMNTVQASAVMGNMYQESKFNSDAHEAGNDIGYGLVQWSFGRRTAYEAYATQKGVAASDIATQVSYIFVEYNKTYKSLLVGTDFEKSTDVAKATEAWMRIFEAPALTPANDPAALNSVRNPAAIQIYGLYKDLGPAIAIDTITSSNCASGNGVVAGSIVKTALGLALQSPATSYNYPESSPTGPGTDEAAARDTYRSAKNTFNPTVAWSDCGGLIATVMISSGVDVNYPLVSVSAQIAYVTSHSEKYTILNNAKESDLQPGDILLSAQAGHTTLYIGPTTIDGKVYTDIDASLGQRVPSVRDSSNHVWMLSNGAIVARVKS